ncbi:carboxylating nicotinate-nucleotide diphosphorylase [candidate division TA06 bacterium]|nr:carboxylating nicotinate-nucleotide diphosphorylase [candidate division TA06 bacterium]
MVDLSLEKVRPIVERALKEDIGSGDLTTKAIIPERAKGLALLTAKEDGVLAGVEVARLVFESVDGRLQYLPEMRDGDRLGYGKVIAQIRGSARSLLTGERVALNFLQRLSGVATLTAQYVEAVEGTRAKVLDTRKTTPGLRILEKYAVRIGGGENHRFGLYDQILIKENHIDSAGGIREAVESIKEKNGGVVFIEVEVNSLRGAKEALAAGVHRIMLDNMDLKSIQEVVNFVEGEVEIEVSGQVTLESIRKIAETGVDYISVGALTHSARAMDISLRLRKIGK